MMPASAAVQDKALESLFQREFSKMVAVISRRFGLEHIEIAEDIVGETFLLAAETWSTKGLPPNPAAWLYAVAKQKALYHFRRNRIFEQNVVPEIRAMQESDGDAGALEFSDQNIEDSQLRMIFAICNPAIVSEAQIGLALRILCGFGIEEIAEAFLTNKETVNKRLFRAKEKLRSEHVTLDLPPERELSGRLENVLRVIYLLFNEGYYSRTQDSILRKDLCLEALRLGLMLTRNSRTNLPNTNALVALMCFHASRFGARQTDGDPLVLYEWQDESLWDRHLMDQGMHFLGLSAEGDELSSYHLEARIASWHCLKEDTPEKWEEILALYDKLLQVNCSPSAMLNRAYALSRVKGVEAALGEVEKLGWDDNHFYFLLLGELYRDIDAGRALAHLQRACALAKTETEREGIRRMIERMGGTREERKEMSEELAES